LIDRLAALIPPACPRGVQEVVLVELEGSVVFPSDGGASPSSTFNLKLTLPPNSYPLS
jgi:hypothetical protein